MIYENVLILNWGKNKDGHFVERQKIKFPKETPVLINFDNDKVVGVASNFKNTPKGITCDVEITDKPTDTIAPSFSCDKTTVDKNKNVYYSCLELKNVSFALSHANEKCDGNLK